VNAKSAVLEGLAHHQAGRLPEAEAAYRQALAVDPDQPDALNLLGALAQHFGHNDDAVTLIERAIAVGPPAAETHNNLANALMAQGRIDAAVDAYTRSIELKPGAAVTHNALGAALMAQGDTARAITSFRRASELDPADAEAAGNLGRACLTLGRLDDAAPAFLQVTRLRPDNAGGHANLGMCLLDNSRFQAAEAAFRRALQCDPMTVEAHIGLALGALADHDYEAALESCGRALAINPQSVEALTNRGVTQEHLGRLEEAAASFRAALHINPTYGEAHRNLGTVTTYQSDDPHIAIMAAALDDPATTAINRLHLNSALAKAYEDIGEFDKAFVYLKACNSLRRDTVSYATVDRDAQVDDIIATFTPALISRFHGAGCESELPVFIVGMPRSGSSLVEQILASHPQIHGAGERRDMGRIAATLTSFGDASPDDLKTLGKTYVDAIRHHGAVRIIDKAPGNFERLGLIHLILPRARIIHCHRDPVDTCLSCFKTLFQEGNGYSYDLTELGHYYRSYERLMDHWRAVLPETILDVRYEDVVDDLETMARRLIDFCGLPWDDACLSFHETERPVHTASVAQVRQPIYKTSMGRWRRYERHLGDLVEALGPRDVVR
jgi:tetratricopeptide (TPR) repeat protein